MDWEKLAEARIREWQGRPPGQRPPAPPAGSVRPLELQLLEEALALRAQAGSASDAERPGLLQRARAAETRLLVLLETSGRPLAARRMAELLAR